MSTHYPLEYLPFLLAWDMNLLPDAEGKHEVEALADNHAMILLASHNVTSNILIKYDRDYEYE